jgi:hypothetical protein
VETDVNNILWADWTAEIIGLMAKCTYAKGMGIQHFVLFSIHDYQKHEKVLLLDIKCCSKRNLIDRNVNFTTICITVSFK